MTEPTRNLPDSAPVSVLDLIVAGVVDEFRDQINSAVDEIYAALSAAFPGLYDDPNAETSRRVEYRILEPGVGHYRVVPPAAAVQAHREGIEVQRRTVTETEWATEPNPNTAKARTQPLPARTPLTGHPVVDAMNATAADYTAAEIANAYNAEHGVQAPTFPARVRAQEVSA